MSLIVGLKIAGILNWRGGCLKLQGALYSGCIVVPPLVATLLVASHRGLSLIYMFTLIFATTTVSIVTVLLPLFIKATSLLWLWLQILAK